MVCIYIHIIRLISISICIYICSKHPLDAPIQSRCSITLHSYLTQCGYQFRSYTLPVPLVCLGTKVSTESTSSIFLVCLYIYIYQEILPALLAASTAGHVYIPVCIYIYIIYLDLYIHASHKDGIRVLVIRLSLNPLNGVSTLTAFD